MTAPSHRRESQNHGKSAIASPNQPNTASTTSRNDSHASPSTKRPKSPVKVEARSPSPNFLHLLPQISDYNDPEVEIVHGWKHPAELEYITPEDWSDTKIIFHLIAHAFSIPLRGPKNSVIPFLTVTGIDGQQTSLPIGYRIPLMFLARFQWLSLKLVLTAASRKTEWLEYKFSILYVCRLCSALLTAARNEAEGMDRKWRCPTFDRALARYRLKWFIPTPAQVKEFWEIFHEDEYQRDGLKFDWRRWALKGHAGFSLTDLDITQGITAEQFMSGLKQKDDQWFWETDEFPVPGGVDAWSLKDSALTSMTVSSEGNSSRQSYTPRPGAPTDPNSIPPSAATPVNPDIPHTAEQRSSTSSADPHVPSHTISQSKSRSSSSSHTTVSRNSLSLPAKTIPRKRPGSPLQKAEKSAPGVTTRPSSTPTPATTPFTPNRINRMAQNRNAHQSAPSISTSDAMAVDAPEPPPTSPLSKSPLIHSISPHFLAFSSFSNGIDTAMSPSRLASHLRSTPTAGSHVVPPSSPSSASALPASEYLSPEAIIHVIDSIFAGFSESLKMFSSEIRQAKKDGVAEVLKELETHHPHSHAQGKQPEEVDNTEFLEAMHTELTSMRRSFVEEARREIRDGVRVIVAFMRTEIVQEMQKRFGEMGDMMARLQFERSERGDTRSPESSSQVRTQSVAATKKTSLPSSSTQPQRGSARQEHMPAHPLQHLLGEPDPFVADNASPDEDEVVDLHPDTRASSSEVDDESVHGDTTPEDDDDDDDASQHDGSQDIPILRL
ncbi:hypothetical protein BDP27DRAFT_1445899 [Rhodocollybia butyracea]|uniref:Uncharacterized protein n=1 Tax=Rhodocollybia butyracea TaxID=206335 RepID=A0A9P5PZT9_9AGAR|nr:hypothetical protein BDP27DRAFT_1445899 [Rhodocollybia butyracea]